MDACEAIERAASAADSRIDFWACVINSLKALHVAEVGVYRGEFAERLLRSCEEIDQYYMIDPWRHLADWNKPANRTDEEFVEIKAEALARTEFAAAKRVVLEGRTADVCCRLPDRCLDFAYIDGDHTLRGITIDLIRVWPKVKVGGVVAGDDFCKSVWQHPESFEPTLVFPFAIYFAEAVGSVVYGLPFNQFAIVKGFPLGSAFEFRDLTGSYLSVALRDAL